MTDAHLETELAILTHVNGRIEVRLPKGGKTEQVTEIMQWACDTAEDDATIWVALVSHARNDASKPPMDLNIVAEAIRIGLTDDAPDARVEIVRAEGGLLVEAEFVAQEESQPRAYAYYEATRIIEDGDKGPVHFWMRLVMETDKQGSLRWRQLRNLVAGEVQRMGDVLSGRSDPLAADGSLMWRRETLEVNSGSLGTAIPLGWQHWKRSDGVWHVSGREGRWILEIRADSVGPEGDMADAIAMELQGFMEFAKDKLKLIEEPIVHTHKGGALLEISFEDPPEKPRDHVWRWYAFADHGDALLVYRQTFAVPRADRDLPETQALKANFAKRPLVVLDAAPAPSDVQDRLAPAMANLSPPQPGWQRLIFDGPWTQASLTLPGTWSVERLPMGEHEVEAWQCHETEGRFMLETKWLRSHPPSGEEDTLIEQTLGRYQTEVSDQVVEIWREGNEALVEIQIPRADMPTYMWISISPVRDGELAHHYFFLYCTGAAEDEAACREMRDECRDFVLAFLTHYPKDKVHRP